MGKCTWNNWIPPRRLHRTNPIKWKKINRCWIWYIAKQKSILLSALSFLRSFLVVVSFFSSFFSVGPWFICTRSAFVCRVAAHSVRPRACLLLLWYYSATLFWYLRQSPVASHGYLIKVVKVQKHLTSLSHGIFVYNENGSINNVRIFMFARLVSFAPILFLALKIQ